MPRYGLATLAAVAVAALAAVACSSDDPDPVNPTRAPDQAATQAPATARATSTPTPPRTLQLVQSYDPAGFPAFTLPRADGGELNSADYIGQQAVAVIFYRGFF